MITIKVNGENKQLPDGASVTDLIAALNLAGRAVAVELNRKVVPRREHAQTLLHDNDDLEVVTLVGGG